MLLDDALEHVGRARVVPGALGVDDRDRAVLADLKAVGLGAVHAALADEAELFQATLEKLPGLEPVVLVAALGLGLIAAEKDVAADDRDAELIGDLLEAARH